MYLTILKFLKFLMNPNSQKSLKFRMNQKFLKFRMNQKFLKFLKFRHFPNYYNFHLKSHK